MAIAARMSPDGSELTIQVSGRFDFSVHQEFRKAYEAGVKPKRFSVDMQNASYLDSSALGMLLLLRDYGGGDGANIQIINCNEDIKSILTVSNFDQLFTIV